MADFFVLLRVGEAATRRKQMGKKKELSPEEQGIKYEPSEKEKEREKKAFELPPVNDNMRRMYAYLLKDRLLDREVVQHFVRAKLSYEDAKFHNVVFVGKDENGKPVHAHKRGTNSKGGFKGNVESSDTEQKVERAVCFLKSYRPRVV